MPIQREEVRAQLEIVLVSHMDEVLPRVLLPREQEVIAAAMSNDRAHETNTNLALTLR